ncbi:MAG: hypothetical protein M0Z99_32230 [Betaproteobacteria bacterium]|nr:hypothetical protein [Betaproteobacteria bacterium]
MKREIQADKEAVLAAFTPGEWLNKAEIMGATGIDKVNYVLNRLIIEKKLIARGHTSSRQWALVGTKYTGPVEDEDPPAAASEPEAEEPEDFIPAMATGKRMVLVRHEQHMVLTAAETQAVSDLIFENFEAA